MATLGNLMVRIGADIEGFKAAMGDMNTKLREAAAEAQKSFGGFQIAADKLTSVGTSLTAALTLPIVGIGVAAAKTAAGFETSMNRVSALGDIVGKDLKKLEDQAMELGRKTMFSSKQAADGMAELAAAGFTTTQIMAAMPGVLSLAAAGQISIGDAAQTTANMMGGFKIAAEGVGHAVDVVAKAAASGSLSVADLSLSMKYVGPVATAAGLAFEEVVAAATLLSNAGIKGEMAGTSLRGMLGSLLNPSKDAANNLARLGIVARTSTGQLLPLEKIIGQLATKGATTQDIFNIFGKEVAASVSALVATSGPALAKLTEELKHSDGASQKMADTIQKGIGGAMEKMQGSIETAAIVLGKLLAPAIISTAAAVEDFANKVGIWIDQFKTLPGWVQNTTLALIGLGAAIGPLLFVLGGIAKSVLAIQGSLLLLKGAMAGMAPFLAAAPWIALAAAIGLAGFKVWEVVKANNALKNSQDVLDATTAKLEQSLAAKGIVVARGAKTVDEYRTALIMAARAEGERVAAMGGSTAATATATSAVLAQGVAYETTGKKALELMTASDEVRIGNLALTLTHEAVSKALDKNIQGYRDAAAAAIIERDAMELLRLQTVRTEVDLRKINDALTQLAEQNAANAEKGLKKVADAFETLGIRSTAALEKMRQDAIDAWLSIANAGGASARDTEEAWAALQIKLAQIDAEIADTSGKKLKKQKDQWETLGKQVSTIVTDFSRDVAKMLFEGGGSIGEKTLGMLKSLGQAVLRTFIEPATDAIAKFISGAIKNLLSGKGLGGILDSIKEIGRGLAGIFGAAGSAANTTSTAASTASTAASTASSVGGAASSTVGGAISGGPVGAIAAAVGAISSIVGNFQMAGMNKTLDLIENYTRYAKGYLLELVNRSETWWKLGPIHDRLAEMLNPAIGVPVYAGHNEPMWVQMAGDVKITIQGATASQGAALLESAVKELKSRGVRPKL